MTCKHESFSFPNDQSRYFFIWLHDCKSDAIADLVAHAVAVGNKAQTPYTAEEWLRDELQYILEQQIVAIFPNQGDITLIHDQPGFGDTVGDTDGSPESLLYLMALIAMQQLDYQAIARALLLEADKLARPR
jgi:hypothetical protein